MIYDDHVKKHNDTARIEKFWRNFLAGKKLPLVLIVLRIK